MAEKSSLRMVAADEWLQPVEEEIERRHDGYLSRLKAIEQSSGSIIDYANGYKYFGWQYDDMMSGWWFREWLPEAYDVYIFGDFNGWQRTQLRLNKDANGVWSIFLPEAMYGYRLTHGSLYKLHIHGANGWLDRIPAYATRVVQDEQTKDYTAQFWIEQPFEWTDSNFSAAKCSPLLIYETHVGMAQEKEGVGTYAEFEKKILPKVRRAGYNAIQVMAIAEHPYYGSFGYHVSNFFAPSSRFGTPEELKSLIDKAHSMGIAVIMDIVHAHYVKNLNEGINELDGSQHHYSKEGGAGYQQYWDSKTFDYGKREVEHFLLSNVKYWMDIFHFDGYRFDGVTSMIYHHFGYTDFDCREKFFDEGVNRDAIVYLTLANKLIHSLNPAAITIAEDVSGMPGIASPVEEGGIGFDYRLAMGVPDFWIKMLKEVPDEQWNVWDIWNVMNNRGNDTGTIAYCESHDQAMQGDQTIAFRLLGTAMYDSMQTTSQNPTVDRGMALHKMIRLVTASIGGQGYLNFMGNEFGHPEWIDFPREGNNWSYKHARSQWSLAEPDYLRYRYLRNFDRAMIALARQEAVLDEKPELFVQDEEKKILIFKRKNCIFALNFNPTASFADYGFAAPAGKYEAVLNTDENEFDGFSRLKTGEVHFSVPVKSENGNGKYEHSMSLYLPSRTALVLKKLD